MPILDSLVVYRKQLGDVLLLQPALTRLARRGSVGIATRPGFADLISLMPGNIVQAPRWPKARQLYCLDPGRGALVYGVLNRGADRHLLTSRSKLRWWHPLLFPNIRSVPANDAYRAAMFCEMLTGDRSEFQPPVLNLPPAEWMPSELPENYGVIHPTAAWKHKTWAPGKWIEALDNLGTGRHWVISSGPAAWERELASELARGLGRRASDLGGRTSLRQYLALLSRSAVTLCVDGSASHLSAAFGRPTLTLFGPTNPLHWHWPSQTTPRLSASDFSTERRPPVDAIPVAAVSHATRQLLELVDD